MIHFGLSVSRKCSGVLELKPQDEPYRVTIEIVNERCKLLRTLEDLRIQQFRVIDVRGDAGGLTRHLVRVPSNQFDKIPRGSLKIQRGGKFEREIFGWFDSDGCDVCNTIVSRGSFLISGRNIKDHTLIYTFITPNLDAFKCIISTLEDSGLKPKVLEVGKYTLKEKILTEKQEKVLWLALEMGFFDYPRKINVVNLSRRLGIGASTLSEITRRGIQRLLKHHFETQKSGPA